MSMSLLRHERWLLVIIFAEQPVPNQLLLYVHEHHQYDLILHLRYFESPEVP